EEDPLFACIAPDLFEFPDIAARAERPRVTPVENDAAGVVLSGKPTDDLIELTQHRARHQIEGAVGKRDLDDGIAADDLHQGRRLILWRGYRHHCTLAGMVMPCRTPMRSKWRWIRST